MISLLFLIPIALVITGIIIWAFIWAIRSGQYLDLDRAGREALYEETVHQELVHQQKPDQEPVDVNGDPS